MKPYAGDKWRVIKTVSCRKFGQVAKYESLSPNEEVWVVSTLEELNAGPEEVALVTTRDDEPVIRYVDLDDLGTNFKRVW